MLIRGMIEINDSARVKLIYTVAQEDFSALCDFGDHYLWGYPDRHGTDIWQSMVSGALVAWGWEKLPYGVFQKGTSGVIVFEEGWPL